jgi:hypothetical protein
VAEHVCYEVTHPQFVLVFDELACGLALALEDRDHDAVGLQPACGRARQADWAHAGADRHGAGEERRAPRRAALLP